MTNAVYFNFFKGCLSGGTCAYLNPDSPRKEAAAWRLRAKANAAFLPGLSRRRETCLNLAYFIRKTG